MVNISDTLSIKRCFKRHRKPEKSNDPINRVAKIFTHALFRGLALYWLLSCNFDPSIFLKSRLELQNLADK